MIRIAVVEDSEADFARIKECLQYLSDADDVQFEIDHYPTGAAFIAKYSPSYDIVFMDIDMPGMNGMETAQTLRQVDRAVVLIFITNMAQYAISGYSVEALDFIIKPINKYSFAMKIRRAIARTTKRTDDTISVKGDGIIHRVQISSIKYLEVSGHYVVYHTMSEDITEYSTLKEVQKRIDRAYFVQCNRSFLVNLKYVDAVNRESVIVDGTEIFISRKMRHSFLSATMDFWGGKNL